MRRTCTNSRKKRLTTLATAAIIVSGFTFGEASAGPVGPGPTKVDGGAYHACTFYPQDGNVNCFGIYPYETSYGDADGSGMYGERADYMGGDAVAFGSGDHNNCVLLSTGNTTCWGYRENENSYAGGDAIQLAVGYGASCVVTNEFNVNCSGEYHGGNLWHQVYGGGDAEWVAMSSYATCIKTTDSNTLTCLGLNVQEPQWTPTGTPTPQAGGHYAMCMVMADGTVDCMNNYYNEGGQTQPPAGLGVGNVVIDLDGQAARTCAALANGDITCWGSHLTSGAQFQTWTYAGVGAVNVTVTSLDICYTTAAGAINCLLSTPDAYGGGGPVDTDGDGVNDANDPCPIDAANDADHDGICGDVDPCPIDAANDADGDGFCESVDNCDSIANADQSNVDDDSYGDACEPDNDGDGLVDDNDNCPLDANMNQLDTDGDGMGDACDADDDGDGVVDGLDWCPTTSAGAPVLSSGCSVAQQCVCNAAWKNHGAYVSCVARATNSLRAAGAITAAQKSSIQTTAGQSSCGAKK